MTTDRRLSGRLNPAVGHALESRRAFNTDPGEIKIPLSTRWIV